MNLNIFKKLGNYDVMILSVFLLWMKSYLINKFYFKLPTDNGMQEFILFINPLSTSLLLFGVIMYLSVKHRNKFMLLGSVIVSLILYADVLFFRFYNDFISLPVLFQTSNAGDLGSSITELLKLSDIFFFVDILILSVYLLLKRKQSSINSLNSKRGPYATIILSMAILLFNLGISEIQRPQLLERTFDRQILVKNLGVINYHVYDAFLQSKTKVQKAFADGDEVIEILNTIEADKEVSTNTENNMTGIAKDKNVVFIALESLQEFVIESDVDGNEITPFLNSLIKDSYYFDNFYHQTAQGKSSDSEFLIDTSMYPLPAGAVYFTNPFNTYNALPKILGENGYSTNVFHANNSSFWNRDQMYKSMGYDKFYDLKSYDVTEENSVGWGLKDKYFFDQSVDYLKELKEPYSAKLITLTNHFPFNLEEEDLLIPVWDSNSGTLNRYFTTVRYMDESLKLLFDRLKEEDLYEDSIFVLYGDHYGISNNHNKAMGTYLNRKIDNYDEAILQKVPLLIHIPGEEGKRISTLGGQIDLKPTLLNLLDIEIKANDIVIGNDLFNGSENHLMVMRNGDFVTDDYISVGGICYDIEKENLRRKNLSEFNLMNKDNNILFDDLEINIVDNDLCDKSKERSQRELDYSDNIIYGDLLRFLEDNTSK